MRLLFLALALFSTDALAAPGWTDPEALPFDALYEPAVGYADGGVEFVAHLEVEGTTDDIHTQLIVTRHAPGQSEVEELRIVSTPTAVPAGMSIAVAQNGAAVLAFLERTNNDLSPLPPLRWRAAYRSPDGTWEAPVTLFTDLVAVNPGTLAGEGPYCAIAPDGTAVAGATHLEPDDEPSEPSPGQTDGRIDVAVRPVGGSWQAAQRLTTANQSASFSALRVDASGNFLLAWDSRHDEGATDDIGDDEETILVRRLLAGSTTWSGIEDVTGPNGDVNFSSAGVAVGASGRAVIAFQKKSDGQAYAAARDDATTSFGSPVQIVTTADTSTSYAAGVADDDSAYVVYSYQGAQDHVGMVKRSAGGSWSGENPVSPLPFDIRDARVAFAGTDAIAVWCGTTNDARKVVQATRWPAAAGIPETFAEIDEQPASITFQQVQSDRAGSVVANWRSGSDRVRAIYDAGAPALVGSTIPVGVIAGVSASFAATFVDAWSPLAGEPAWGFGDGTADGSGATVAHTFASPGDYTVSATIADTFGNARVSTFPLAVSACESLAGVDGVACRCTNGLALGVSACDGAAVPDAVGRKFDVACQAVTAAQGATSAKKGRKAAAKAAKSFKKAAAVLKGKKAKSLPAACRDALATVLGTAKDRATALKGAL